VVVEADDMRITVIGTDSEKKGEEWKEHDNDQQRLPHWLFDEEQFHTTPIRRALIRRWDKVASSMGEGGPSCNINQTGQLVPKIKPD